MTELNKQQVEQAQQKWADGIVAISAAFMEKQDYAAVAEKVVDELYGYACGPVLFKPTKAAQAQFRDNRDTALSYFVAKNGQCPEDKGFAIHPWTKVRFDNHNIAVQGSTALAMGNYFFTDTDGQEHKVEYTFGYFVDPDGTVRINLHHSSVPFAG